MPIRPDHFHRLISLTLLVAALSFATHPTAAARAQDRRAAPDWVDPTEDKLPPGILVYYFHNTVRCRTCLAMESMAEEAIRGEFADDLDSGVLVWRTINLQNPECEHFASQYDLDGPSLVMVEWADGKEVRWKNLERIWEFADSPVQYRQYVSRELAAYIDGEPETPEKE